MLAADKIGPGVLSSPGNLQRTLVTSVQAVGTAEDDYLMIYHLTAPRHWSILGSFGGTNMLCMRFLNDLRGKGDSPIPLGVGGAAWWRDSDVNTGPAAYLVTGVGEYHHKIFITYNIRCIAYSVKVVSSLIDGWIRCSRFHWLWGRKKARSYWVSLAWTTSALTTELRLPNQLQASQSSLSYTAQVVLPCCSLPGRLLIYVPSGPIRSPTRNTLFC